MVAFFITHKAFLYDIHIAGSVAILLALRWLILGCSLAKPCRGMVFSGSKYGRIFCHTVKSLTWISIFQSGPPNKGSVAKLMPITTSYINGNGSCATLTHLSTTWIPTNQPQPEMAGELAWYRVNETSPVFCRRCVTPIFTSVFG